MLSWQRAAHSRLGRWRRGIGANSSVDDVSGSSDHASRDGARLVDSCAALVSD